MDALLFGPGVEIIQNGALIRALGEFANTDGGEAGLDAREKAPPPERQGQVLSQASSLDLAPDRRSPSLCSPIGLFPWSGLLT